MTDESSARLRDQGAEAFALGAQVVLRWFLVFTKPSGERTAKVNLERQGYTVYYPQLRHPSHYRGRWIDRIVPLFPRYLFVQLDEGRQSLSPVRSTFGVADIVRFGSRSAVVPDAIVRGLMGRAEPGSGLHRLSRDEPLEPGLRVNVVAGPFEGLDGVFQREVGEDRVVVLLRLLGQDAPVRIPSRYVVPSVA